MQLNNCMFIYHVSMLVIVVESELSIFIFVMVEVRPHDTMFIYDTMYFASL